MSPSTSQMYLVFWRRFAIRVCVVAALFMYPGAASYAWARVAKGALKEGPIAPQGPRCRTAKLLDGKLFRLKNNKPEAYNIDHKKVGLYAIYFSASWCPPCRKFTPELLRFYAEHRKTHKNFEIILVHHTERSPSAMMRYLRSALKKAGLRETFPVMGFKSTPKDKKGIKVYATKAIPGLVLLDGNERVLAGSYEGYKYIGPEKAFRKMHELLGIKEDASAPKKATEK